MGLLDGLTSGSFLGSLASGALGLAGTALGNDSRMDLAKYNAAMQKEFAQNSIKWKVEDAKRAGVHPMAALGVSTSSFSPVSAQFESPDFSFLKDMGQNLDREALAAKDQEARDQAESFAKESNGLTLEKMGLENDILREELASIRAKRANNTQIPPAAPPVNPDDVQVLGSPHSSNTPQGFSNFGSSLHNLFSVAVHGNAALLFINPDIADSITESTRANLAADVISAIEHDNPEIIDDFIRLLPKKFQNGINDGRLRLRTVPGTNVIRITPVLPGEDFNRYKVFDY